MVYGDCALLDRQISQVVMRVHTLFQRSMLLRSSWPGLAGWDELR